MLSNLLLSDVPPRANEPPVHQLIKDSFIFVPTAGMRHAPEILVTELFREVFFENHSEGATRELDIEGENMYSLGEKAIIGALRGRQKQSRRSKTLTFYAPAYPELSRNAWLGKKRGRVIVNFLLGSSGRDKGNRHEVCAPVAQYFSTITNVQTQESMREEFAERFADALIGKRRPNNNQNLISDILSEPLRSTSFEIDRALAVLNLRNKTRSSIYIDVTEDPLSSRIYADLVALIDLEGSIPRLQWVHLFMTFLRFVLPMWLLAQMKMTTIVYEMLLDALDQGILVSSTEISKMFINRNKDLLTPSLTPTRELFEHTQRYMKQRVELTILLRALDHVTNNSLDGKKLYIFKTGRTCIRIEDLLGLAKQNAEAVRSCLSSDDTAGLPTRNLLIRLAEQFAAWRNPLKGSQGKNIDEFFRVLFRNYVGDEEGGFLLVPSAGGRSAGFRIYPGQLLIKVMTYLAAEGKQCVPGGGGQLVLQDVEEHFRAYGIDFGFATDVRPMVIKELKAMGLLYGSPDAGSSVAVLSPYKKR